MAGFADAELLGLYRAALPLDAVQRLRHTHRHKMAVIIPYRDRQEMLNKFLPALHSFLKVQNTTNVHPCSQSFFP